jgi:hypothetical protein
MDPQSDDQVVRLLRGLKRVNAPENFESRLKVRLSNAPPESGRLGFLKLALPTAALAALALFLLLSGYIGPDMPSTGEVVTDGKQKETRTAQPATPKNQNPAIPNESARPSKDFRAGDIPQTQPPALVNSSPDAVNSSQGVKNRKGSFGSQSYDIGSGVNSPEVILPRGFSPKSLPGTDANSEKEMRRPSIAALDLLRYAGVSMDLRGNEWIVSSIVQKSPAERIGLKVGDVIVSLNDIRIGNGSAFPSGVDLKTIRVKRGGSMVDLKF